MVRGNFNPGHDPDRVLADVTMVLADGGEAIADIDVLRHQAGARQGGVAAHSFWRTLKQVTPGRLNWIAIVRARTLCWTPLRARTEDPSLEALPMLLFRDPRQFPASGR